MTKTLKLKKAVKDIIEDVDGLTIHVTEEDTKEKSSLFLLNVNLTTESQSKLDEINKQIQSHVDEINKLENQLLDIEVILPAILEKQDFSKVELNG